MENTTRENQPKSKVKLQISSGGIVYNPLHDEFLLILDSYKRWALPKGKIESGETPEQTAMREIGEETGLDHLKILRKIGKIQYFFRLHKQAMFKIVHIFLLETNEEKLTPCKIETKDAKWFKRDEAIQKISYKNAKNFLIKANNIILQEGIYDSKK